MYLIALYSGALQFYLREYPVHMSCAILEKLPLFRNRVSLPNHSVF